MSDIPSEICYDILLRIPAVHLSRFRSVCKAWRSIIDDDGFVNMHIQGGYQLLIRNNTGRLFSLPLSSIDCSKNHTITVEMMSIKNLILPRVPRILSLPVPSIRGLILIMKTRNHDGMVWTVWNPLTRESFQLPPHYHLVEEDTVYYGGGIGYDFATDDFKVVMIAPLWGPGNITSAHTIIYSLKLNYWKSVPNFKTPIRSSDPGVFVNGALHWITRRDIITAHIVSLDLSTEEGHVLPRPSFLSEGQSLRLFYLDMLDGCLCLRDDHAIWMMKDYGENVWTKLVSVEQLPDMGRPIAFIKGKGQLLFQQKTAELLLFDVEKKCGKKVSIEGINADGVTYQVLTSSLFRLNRTAGGDGSIDIKRTLKRKRKTADNRLEVEVEISDV